MILPTRTTNATGPRDPRGSVARSLSHGALSVRPGRVAASLFVAAAAGCLAGGCVSGLPTRAGSVTVVTEAGEPVAQALVRADPIDPRHPLNFADYLRGDTGTLGAWTTDQRGEAAITLLRDRPTTVSFAAAGFLPGSRFVDTSDGPTIRLVLVPIAGADQIGRAGREPPGSAAWTRP